MNCSGGVLRTKSVLYKHFFVSVDFDWLVFTHSGQSKVAYCVRKEIILKVDVVTKMLIRKNVRIKLYICLLKIIFRKIQMIHDSDIGLRKSKLGHFLTTHLKVFKTLTKKHLFRTYFSAKNLPAVKLILVLKTQLVQYLKIIYQFMKCFARTLPNVETAGSLSSE